MATIFSKIAVKGAFGMRYRTLLCGFGLFVTTILVGSTAFDKAGASKVYYNYDSQNRVYRVCNALNNDAELTGYALDAAGNRQNYVNTKTDITLYPGAGGLTSPDGRFYFVMQTDGNLVLYQKSNWSALWNTGTTGISPSGTAFQSDGNLVIYDTNAKPVWSSGTNAPCAHLAVQSDGNVVIYNADNQPVWATNTGGH